MAVQTIAWKRLALVTTTTTILLALLLPALCHGQRELQATPAASLEPSGVPQQGFTPTEARSKAPVETEMRNVSFHLDRDTLLEIHRLRGDLVPKESGAPVDFDNKLTFILRIDTARIGMRAASLDNLMNRYVFGYPHAPLHSLHVTLSGNQLLMRGVIHKGIDLPFTMRADVSAWHGFIRIHPAKMEISIVNGISLLKTIGETIEKLVPLRRDRGVFAEGNDLLLDPAKILPPPQAEVSLTEVSVQGDELVQVFDAGRHAPPLRLPRPEEKNWMYYRGGTLRMGKLLMLDADMQVIDTDPSDSFDFYLDHYNDQLVAGFSRNEPNYGLLAYMRDFDDLGKPLKKGERGP